MYAQKAKAEVRELILKKRDVLSTEERIEGSICAAELANNHIVFEPGTIISGFFPIRSEIDPRPLMDHLRKRGAILCLPVVVDKTRIIFRELVPGAALIDTGFGTKGPGSDARIVDPQIMLVPLSVFDRKGGRIGYGAGYYDQAIARLIDMGNTPKTIGMAFDCQQYDLVPQEPHDVAMDAIVTENGYRES
ncbi:MAG: 5-formyltetrahydrofolate cyclo-ligase [Hyphomicrobiales bacterium]|nr:5-formyltetrahydrofolate cyclo-ligase [Hyphomicrobiales bacterium]